MFRTLYARFVPVFLVLALCCMAGHAQIIYTKSFTRTLDQASLSFHKPTEQWMHVVPESFNEHMRATLILQNDRNDFEVRYRIRRESKLISKMPPSVEVSRLLAHIASNDPQHDIAVTIPPDEMIADLFNADTGVMASFIPKRTFSEKPYGTLLTLVGHGKSVVDVVFLSSDPDYSPLESFRSLSFR